MEALEALNSLSGETMTLFVVDGAGRLLGSLTDGDIRRALLSGKELLTPVGSVCKRGCLRIESADYDVAGVARAREMGISLLPVVREGVIVGVVDLNRQRGLIPADAVLMAGGAGERLRPLTLDTPKPLLPVNGIPIIDHNIRLLRSFGINRIFVVVNYLKEKLKAHLEPRGVAVVEEPMRMGTIGGVRLIEGFEYPNVLVMNSDLLTDVNLEAMYLKHLETEAVLTMAVVPYSVSVPFAVVEHSGDRVEGLTEKPTYNYYANAGIYLLRRSAVDRIPKNAYTDATDLISMLLKEGERVSLFPVDSRWLDIGSPDDYRRATE